MRIVQVATFAASMLFLACAAPQPVYKETKPVQPVQKEIKAALINTKFDNDVHKPYMQKGNNTIKGQGFLRQQGGGVVTCAGNDTLLMPATPYFREMLSIMRDGKKPIGNVDPAYKTMLKQTKADAQGNFTFSDLPDGNWFVLAEVIWTVGYQKQGGGLVQEVRVSNGETKQVLLTQNDLVLLKSFGDF